MLWATMGIPYTTQDSLSCPMVNAPALRICKSPSAPSRPMPVMMMPTILHRTCSAMEKNRASTEGRWPLTFSPWEQETV